MQNYHIRLYKIKTPKSQSIPSHRFLNNAQWNEKHFLQRRKMLSTIHHSTARPIDLIFPASPSIFLHNSICIGRDFFACLFFAKRAESLVISRPRDVYGQIVNHECRSRYNELLITFSREGKTAIGNFGCALLYDCLYIVGPRHGYARRATPI